MNKLLYICCFSLLIFSCEKSEFENEVQKTWNVSYDYSGSVLVYCEGSTDTTESELAPMISQGTIEFNEDFTGSADGFLGMENTSVFTWIADGEDLILTINDNGILIDSHLKWIENIQPNKKVYKLTLFGIKGGCYQSYENAKYEVIFF